MQGIITLLLILTPMFVGFALPNSKKSTHLAERGLNYLVFIILMVIGMELGLVDDLQHKLANIALYLSVLMVLTIGSGLMALVVFDRISPCQYRSQQSPTAKPNVSIHGSLTQILCLAMGFIIAKFLPATWHPPEKTTTVLLMLLLFLVGISLKGSGVSLKQALLNKRGLQISSIFVGVTLLSGVLFALLFDDVSVAQGLALSSSFGWYSLSGTIMTDAYGAVWGSVALLNDLGREVLALIFIPWVMRHSSSAAIGLGGVTSLDFTLPTLTQAGGASIIPLVISFGFITNLISPVLMVFFASFS
ncbi:lysine exporter LysO family protein [Moraxella bovis]|uniref:Lysine exporter LysO family protein n=1 Tax=Moraxella bovis TaxID=476 RepID=A0AAQ2QEE5_MORBO|nr:lysine exporter LysO family protein [Moraxella bovis]AWY21700.1 lysine exporter LysO family protein [Moraxella bovis]OOR87581.1 hypothetical protein B0182_11880 [Moraxella bovis]UYZ76992.1 lysine exporter LysO family protein [Moraxella bovis]UYZ79665.1 lysine exporter LysO family protein [Moraxella bovis]UYZ82464.1 lysine exporter LysO family protein [Moraxella bovis]